MFEGLSLLWLWLWLLFLWLLFLSLSLSLSSIYSMLSPSSLCDMLSLVKMLSLGRRTEFLTSLSLACDMLSMGGYEKHGPLAFSISSLFTTCALPLLLATLYLFSHYDMRSHSSLCDMLFLGNKAEGAASPERRKGTNIRNGGGGGSPSNYDLP